MSKEMGMVIAHVDKPNFLWMLSIEMERNIAHVEKTEIV
jgi:hypothetical protein